MELFWNFLSLIGGASLFLFGMKIMGQGLEKQAGGRLKHTLGRLTASPWKGLLLGAGLTAAVQSSSAVTVMVVGFVNAGTVTLRQAVGVIMGANVGTTLTSWLLSLSQIGDGSPLLRLLSPASLTSVAAFAGILLYLLPSSGQKKNAGQILLGFSTLLYGMRAMSGAVEPLAEEEWFRELFLLFSNPLLGILAGAVLTALLQSSSASVGVLQALSLTGELQISAAIPIILGQNIGTCVTTLLSAVGGGKNARRAATVHLYFNSIGSLALAAGFYLINAFVRFPFLNLPVTPFHIALIHTLFNLLCTLLWLPFSAQLEKLAVLTVRGGKEGDAADPPTDPLPDPRLLATPPLAVAASRGAVGRMAVLCTGNAKTAIRLFSDYREDGVREVERNEERADRMEDGIGDYLASLSARDLSQSDSREVTVLLHLVSDLERVSDHAMNLSEAAEAAREEFPEALRPGFGRLCAAVEEILTLALNSFLTGNAFLAARVEPLEQVIDELRRELRNDYALLLRGERQTGFLFAEVLTDLERIADHCSNVAGWTLYAQEKNLTPHGYQKKLRGQQVFEEWEKHYRGVYLPSHNTGQ